nr:MAG TPA: hypothetical protein [Caudoviricetes sp.]
METAVSSFCSPLRSLIQPLLWNSSGSPLEAVLFGPLFVGRPASLADFRIGRLEKKPKIKFRVLLFDKQVFLSVFQHEPALRFQNDLLSSSCLDDEVGGVYVVRLRNPVVNLFRLKRKFHPATAKVCCNLLFQPGAEPILLSNLTLGQRFLHRSQLKIPRVAASKGLLILAAVFLSFLTAIRGSGVDIAALFVAESGEFTVTRKVRDQLHHLNRRDVERHIDFSLRRDVMPPGHPADTQFGAVANRGVFGIKPISMSITQRDGDGHFVSIFVPTGCIALEFQLNLAGDFSVFIQLLLTHRSKYQLLQLLIALCGILFLFDFHFRLLIGRFTHLVDELKKFQVLRDVRVKHRSHPKNSPLIELGVRFGQPRPFGNEFRSDEFDSLFQLFRRNFVHIFSHFFLSFFLFLFCFCLLSLIFGSSFRMIPRFSVVVHWFHAKKYLE